MKSRLLFSLPLLFIIISIPIYSQQKVEIVASLDSISTTFHIQQKINFKNIYQTPIEKLIINDWNHSYSNRKTHLGQRFSDQYVRNFHLSTQKERGYTKISTLKVNGDLGNWQRIENQIDLIELKINKLIPGDSIEIIIDYELKIPDAKFTRWGNEKGNFHLKDFFLSIAKINNSSDAVRYSNENIEDAVLEEIDNISVEFKIPSYYSITSNLNKVDKTKFEGTKAKDIQFALEKRFSFESYKNDILEVDTNLKDSRVNEFQRAIIIDKIINYVNANVGKSSVAKIMVSQIDYERNPFYGLNQLPAFLSPFPDSFLYELKFLKAYSQNYLKQNLNIDFRKDHYLIDGIQTYLLINYIEEFYPDLHLLGSLSNYKITKGYQLTKAKFNDQYHLAYLLMARKNIDQSLNQSKERLVKFNEQIASKYKAGLAFKFLDNYLNNDVLNKSISEFINLNKTTFSSNTDFETILKKNSTLNIDWFFDKIINSNKSIDYSFGRKSTVNGISNIIIKNKTNSNVPYLVSGFKNRTKIFDKWINHPKKDTTITINDSIADRLILNDKNYFTEINNRNNYKSLKRFGLNKPIKFIFLRDIENANYNQVFYYPEIGFNVYDGAILSMSFNNRSLIERPFTYNISPGYSTNTGSISGNAFFNYVFQHENKNQFQTRLSLSTAYFHYLPDASYFRLTPSIQFRFRENDIRDNKFKSISIRQVIVAKEDSPLLINDTSPLNYSVFDSRFSYGDTETSYGFGVSTNLQFSGKFGKLITEFNYRKLFESNIQIGVRLFAGTFLYNNSNTDYFDFGLDRPKDYLFDYQFYGRSENSGFFSQQIVIAEGGFKSKFVNPYANQWISSIGLTTSVWKWIQLYGDFGVYKNRGLAAKSVFDSGIHLNLVPDYFEVFFPVYSSNGLEISQNKYAEKVRFQFTLNPKVLIGIFTRKWF
ncbi:MAG: aminopeptidase [Bacteroidota bacterium]